MTKIHRMLASVIGAGALLGLAPVTLHAEGPTLSVDTMKRVTEELSSDEFEGRAPGTVGEEKTLALLESEFKRAGLQPGNHGSWYQNVPLVEITAENVSRLEISGGEKPLSLAYGADMVVFTYRVTPHIDIKGSEMVFVGYGINAPEKNWNDYAGMDVKGKTVVILVNDPDYESERLDGTFNGRAMTYYGRWSYKYEEAARQGAAAALIIHDTVPAAYGWNVVESSNTGPQHVADADNGHMDQTLANGWIQRSSAHDLLASAGHDLDQLTAAAQKPGFKAIDLGLKASLSFDNRISHQSSSNVVGILPGTEAPDEYVLYTAHWDHLGHCGADQSGDDICNGAVDNATGTAALVALAEAQVKAGPARRTLVFLAVTAEESGLLGSESYAANPVFPLSQTVGGVNMDAFSMAGPARDVVVVGMGKSELDDYLKRAVAAQHRVARREPTPEKGYYYRSDHFSLAKRGVPMLYFEGGEDLVNGGVAAGRAVAEEFTANHYHAPSDEYDPHWDWSGVMADLDLYYSIGRELANDGRWPNWLPDDEFRAVRDASRTDQ